MKYKAWIMIAGAAKYLSAMALGDRASEYLAWVRSQTCAACPSLKLYRLPMGAKYGTCGKQFEETNTTCGCLVLTVEGEDLMSAKPAGKCCVLSEHCPHGKW